MSYDFKFTLGPDQVDALVVLNLQEAYEDCVFTLFDLDKQKFDPIEDVVHRQEGLATVLQYYMVPKEYEEYMEYCNNYTQEDYDESKATGSDQ